MHKQIGNKLLARFSYPEQIVPYTHRHTNKVPPHTHTHTRECGVGELKYKMATLTLLMPHGTLKFYVIIHSHTNYLIQAIIM